MVSKILEKGLEEGTKKALSVVVGKSGNWLNNLRKSRETRRSVIKSLNEFEQRTKENISRNYSTNQRLLSFLHEEEEVIVESIEENERSIGIKNEKIEWLLAEKVAAVRRISEEYEAKITELEEERNQIEEVLESNQESLATLQLEIRKISEFMEENRSNTMESLIKSAVEALKNSSEEELEVQISQVSSMIVGILESENEKKKAEEEFRSKIEALITLGEE
ncbi:MAG: hypothetical protein ACFFD4_33245 [Candidatus Odinarchaeota archaeon]